MIVYVILMFLMAVLFAGLAFSIHRGNLQLIHDYHRQNVKDPGAYGRAFGKALGLLPITFLISGILALFWMLHAVAVLLLGIICGIAALLAVQKKYNGGLF